jgi:pimeloyl-ACP methyl ester carboxylesterase
MATMDDLDARIRASERDLYAHYGLQPRERTVDLAGPGLTVRLTEFGPTSTSVTQVPVLLLHGIASVSAAAAPVLPYLAGRRVIAVDWPGHGLSGPAILARTDPVRVHAVGVLREICAALDIDRADVVGHSMGAQFGLYLAADWPQVVRRLVLVGAPGAGFAGVRPVPAMRLLSVPGLGRAVLAAPLSRAGYRRNSEGMLGKGVLDRHPPGVTEVGYLAGRRPGFAPSVSSFFRALITPRRVRDGVALTPAELTGLAAPTLLVWGTADVFMKPQNATDSVAAIPDHTLVTVPGAGHLPWLDDAEACGRAIADFLAADQPGSQRPRT